MNILVMMKWKYMKNKLKKLIDSREISQYGSVVKSYIGWYRLPSNIEDILFDMGFKLEMEWDDDRGMCYYYNPKVIS